MVAEFSLSLIESILPNSHSPLFSKKKTIGVSTDTRTIKPGELFIGLNGEHFRGIDFANQAKEKGAGGLILNQTDFTHLSDSKKKLLLDNNIRNHFICLVPDTLSSYGALAKFHLKKFQGIKIAITGSAGKTTTKQFLNDFLSLKYKVLTSEKNYNNLIGVPKTIFTWHEKADIYLFEFGMNTPNEIKQMSFIVEPDVSIITNIMGAHLGNFVGLNGIAEAKAEIFIGQPPQSRTFLPKNDDFYSFLLYQTKKNKLKVHTFPSIKISNYINIEKDLSYNNHLYLENLPGNVHELHTPTSLIGPHQVKNLALAIQVAFELDVSIDLLLEHIKDIRPVKSRLNILGKNPLLIDDAYNANLQSMHEAVEWVIELNATIPKTLILGDVFELGAKSEELHREFGTKVMSHLKLHWENSDVEIIFCGKYMKEAADALDWDNKRYYKNTCALFQYLTNNLEKNRIYFFKASNSMGFQRGIHSLTQHI